MDQSKEDTPDNLSSEEERGEDIQQYIEENKFLKETVIRLTKELLACQKVQCPNENGISNQNTSNGENEIEIPNWILKSSVVSPLFSAYDARIKELSSYIEHQGSCLDKLTASVRNLTVENEKIRKGQQKVKHDSNGTIQKQQLEEDKDLLEEQAELLVKELDHANQCIASRDKSMTELTEELQSKLAYVKSLDEKSKQQLEEKRNVERQLLESMEEAATYRQLNNDLNSKLKESERQKSTSASEASVAKAEREDLEKRNDELHDELIELSTSVQELQQRLMDMSSSYERLNEDYIGQRKEVGSLKKENERLAQDISRLRLKECQLVSIAKVHELEIAKDKLDAKVISLEKHIDQMNDRNVRLMEIVGVGSDVDEMLHSQHALEVEKKDNLLMEQKLQANELKFKITCLERKLQDAIDGKAQLNTILQAERGSRAFDELKQTLQAANEDLQIERKGKKEAIEKVRNLKAEMTKAQGIISSLRQDQDAMKMDQEKKTDEWLDKLSKQECLIDELMNKAETSKLEYEEHLRISRETSKNAEIALQCTIIELETKLKETEISVSDSKEALQDMKTELDKLRKQYHNELKNTKSSIEGLENDFTKLNKELEMQVRDITAECSSLTDEKLALTTALKSKESESDHISRKFARSENKLVSLSRELGLSLKDQKERIEKEKKLKMENHMLKMKCNEFERLVKVNAP